MFSMKVIVAFALLCAASCCADEFTTVQIPGSADGAIQKALWWSPDQAGRAVPLLVALHSWSSDYRQAESLEYLKRCRERGWAVIHPDFRGPNRTPPACGSDRAVADVVDAVAFARSRARIDARRIYLAGVSGGGYMALVMAQRHPEIWAAVSAWVPISDLAAWHAETGARGLRYAADMDAVFGGPPGRDTAIDGEYRRRSPLFHLSAARGLPVDINAGIHDGHSGSVPVSHSLLAFNALAAANGFSAQAISDDQVRYIVARERLPEDLGPVAPDSTYSKPVLFRRDAGPARVTLFDGGHEMLMDAAFAWLERFQKP